MTRHIVAIVPLLLGAVLVPGSLAGSPRPIPRKGGCTDWEGTASGNDPKVLVRLQVCRAGDKVTGTFQWSSPRSGWNERLLAGTVENGRLRLADVSFLEYQPAQGWRFCLIDRYELAQRGARMTGSYVSAECADRATLSLRRAR